MDVIEAVLEAKGSRLHAVKPDASVLEAVETMCAARVGAVLVMDGGKLLGVFSERDLMTRVVLARLNPSRTIVKDVMTPKPVCIGLIATPRNAMGIMTSHRVRHLPVVYEGRVVGVISIGDIVRWSSRARQQEVEELRDYVAGGYAH
jgi:CBS domain-containing protein